MRESDSSESVLRRYESPAMRVVPTDGGRIVVGSPVNFVGDTGSLGAFDNTGGYNWNVGSVEGGLGGLGLFEDDGASTFWNAAANTGGGLVGFDPVVDQEWNSGTASNSGVGRFESDAGPFSGATAPPRRRNPPRRAAAKAEKPTCQVVKPSICQGTELSIRPKNQLKVKKTVLVWMATYGLG